MNKVKILGLILVSNLLIASSNKVSQFEELAKLRSIDDPVVSKEEKAKATKLVKKTDPATAEFMTRLKKIQSLAADFTQTEQALADINTAQGTSSDGRVLKGRVRLAKPDKLLWEITIPEQEKQIYVTNGSKFWHYDKGLEQVVLDKYDSKRIINSPLYFLLVNADKLTENYTVKQADKDAFELNPNNAAKMESNYTTGLKLKFKPGTSTLIQVSFIAAQNKQITIDLDNVKINTGVSSAMFNFNMPAGVDIINASELY